MERPQPGLDQVTLAGRGPLTWHPQFNYHGFRYLELTGLTQAPAPSDFTALVLRTADERAGSFSSSDALLNDIHSIQNRAMQSNMYSVFTDCPHREKLGWLDQINLVYDSLSKNYDVEAHYRKVLRDMADAQTTSGLIPDITPEYTESWSGTAATATTPTGAAASSLRPGSCTGRTATPT